MMWTIGVSPPSLGYFLRAPPRSRAPSGGNGAGRRSQPVDVPQDGLTEADEGCSPAAVGPDRTRQECLDGHAAGVLIAQIALQVRVVDARPSRVRIPGHYQIRGHHVLFRSRVRLSDVHGRSRTVRGLERLIVAPVDLLFENAKIPRGEERPHGASGTAGRGPRGGEDSCLANRGMGDESRKKPKSPRRVSRSS